MHTLLAFLLATVALVVPIVLGAVIAQLQANRWSDAAEDPVVFGQLLDAVGWIK